MADVIIKPVMSQREQDHSAAICLAQVQQEEEMKGMRMEIVRLRQVISCAYCPVCSEEIADQEWEIDERERLVHKGCADEPE